MFLTLSVMTDRMMFYGASTRTVKKAEMLRSSMTPAEKHLWRRLRKNRLKGFRFKPQHPISEFVVDFYCHKARLVIEVDESYHENPIQKDYDKNRDYILKEFGLTILRFTDHQVIKETESVIQTILEHLTIKQSSHD